MIRILCSTTRFFKSSHLKWKKIIIKDKKLEWFFSKNIFFFYLFQHVSKSQLLFFIFFSHKRSEQFWKLNTKNYLLRPSSDLSLNTVVGGLSFEPCFNSGPYSCTSFFWSINSCKLKFVCYDKVYYFSWEGQEILDKSPNFILPSKVKKCKPRM